MLFDPDWYLRTYPDVAAAGIDPLRHYLQFGAAEGRDPSPLFCTRWYLDTYPDVAQAGINPLQHYLSHGIAEGRLPAPDKDRLPAPNKSESDFGRRGPSQGPSQGAVAAATDLIEEFSASEFDLARLRTQPLDALPIAPDLPQFLRSASDPTRMLFDPDWYLRTYPDVAAAGIDPLRHYLQFGAAEGRDPSPLFCTRWYLDTYTDVAEAGINPLQHYLSHGIAEGRLPAPNKSESDFGRRGPSQGAVAAATDLIEEFSVSEFDLARLRTQPLDALPVAPDLPQSLADGWRNLYLSLDRVPRTLLIVPSLDDERLRRHLLCVCNHAIASGDPSALLVLAVDEALASVGAALPPGVIWRSLAEFHPDLEFQHKVAILVALIHGLRPQAVLVLDSHAGWDAIARHGAAMCRYSGLFAACAGPVQNASAIGEDGGFERRYLRQCLPSLAAVYASDPQWIEECAARYGLPAASRRKFRLLPPASPDAEWVSMLSREPGFLANKRASRP